MHEPQIAFLDLVALFESLRARGFNVSTEQLIEAEKLRAELMAIGNWPAEITRQKYILGPLFSSNPLEQAEFNDFFDTFTRQAGEGAEQELHSERFKQVNREHADTSVLEDTSRMLRRFYLDTIVIAVLMASAVGAVFYFTVPVEGPVEFDTKATVDQSQPASERPVVKTEAPSWQQLAADFRKERIADAEEWKSIIKTRRADISSKRNEARDVADAEVNKLTVYTISLAAALPFGLFLLWWLGRWFRRRAWLAAAGRRSIGSLATVRVKAIGSKIFSTPKARHDAQRLRRHHSIPTRRIDVDETIEASIKTPGRLAPVYRNRAVLPEHLVLIDQFGRDDHLTNLVDEFVSKLQRSGLTAEIYHYFGDPRVCFPNQRNAKPVTLDKLEQQFGGSRLIIFGDGRSLFDPLHQTPRAWTSVFEAWPKRCVVSENAFAEWSVVEAGLFKIGFAVVPLSETGFSWLTTILTDEEDASAARFHVPPDIQSSKPLPAMLVRLPERWLEPSMPQGEHEDSLIEALRSYLGPFAFRWLASTAVYPLPVWTLTVYLGERLAEFYELPAPSTEDHVLLSRLPWFRHAFLPHYLRLRLLDELSSDELAFVRTSINDLLGQLFDQSGKTVDLEVAYPEHLWRQQLDSFLGTALPGTPERDDIFVSFMMGNRPEPGDFELDGGAKKNFSRPFYSLIDLQILLRGAMFGAVSLVIAGFGILPNPSFNWVRGQICDLAVDCGRYVLPFSQEQVALDLQESISDNPLDLVDKLADALVRLPNDQLAGILAIGGANRNVNQSVVAIALAIVAWGQEEDPPLIGWFDPRQQLEQALRQGQASTREAAAEGLGRVLSRTGDGSGPLTVALSDNAAKVRIAAAQALAVGRRSVNDLTVERLRSVAREDENEAVRYNANLALVVLGREPVPQRPTIPSPASGQTTGEIKIGSVGGITGPIAELVTAIIKGRQLAADEVNKSVGGLLDKGTLLLIEADSACDSKAGAAAAAKLVDLDQVVSIVGANCSGATLGMSETTVSAGVTVLSDSATAPSISEVKDNDTIFRVAPSDAYQGRFIADVIWNAGVTRVAVTYSNDDYNAGMASVFVTSFEALGGTVTGNQAHEPNKASYRADLSVLSQGKPEALALFAYYGSSGITIIRNSLESQLFDKFYGSDGMYDASVINQLGADNLFNKLWVTQATTDTSDPSFKAFAEAYTAIDGDPAAPYASHGYDAVFLMALAIEQARVAQRDKISSALRQVAGPGGEVIRPGEWAKAKQLIADGKKINYQGASGPLDFDSNGDVAGVFVVNGVQANGTWSPTLVGQPGADLNSDGAPGDLNR